MPPGYVGKRGAQRYLAERERDRAQWLAGQITFQKAAQTWAEVTKTRVKPTSFQRYESVLVHHLLPEFGPLYIQRLRPADIQRFITQKCTELAPSTVRNSVAFVLSSVLDLAVQHEQLLRSPMPRRLIYPRQETPKVGRALTPKEVKALLEASDGPIWPILVTCIWSGMRIGEVLAMRWRHLDEAQRRYNVTETLTLDRRFQSAKTRSSAAPVALSPNLLHVLKIQQQQVARRRLQAKKWTDMDLIFPNPHGQPLTYGWVYHHFQRALQSANLGGPLRLHDLRHTTAALLAREGADIKTISEQLRHSSITITMDIYGHLYPEQRDEAVARLDRLLEMGR